MERYTDRGEAGKILAEHLIDYKKKPNTLVLALPRGGVPVGFAIATALSIPLDVLLVRKLGVPGHKEFAFGALASGNTVFVNENIVRSLALDEQMIKKVMADEEKELARRQTVYRGGRPFPALKNKSVILVDDGMATGATMRAAIHCVYQHKPASVIVAVPVAAYATCEEVSTLVDRLVCPFRPENFYAVGLWYDNFDQTTDEEVSELLTMAQAERLESTASS
ncbi:phosphoribosyltransferase [Legionella sp. MW5194]|uniref:phosphoribosyltransferase n=1 Tax=Legionella sp. MW5194 TaxID=2662448 RepID=UPI00193DD3CA|nr:phosphoribosyltransferase [Legionella sp. MW5194]QRN03583.1 phosphoribosyltransferase [Legionella sp. MW5194]